MAKLFAFEEMEDQIEQEGEVSELDEVHRELEGPMDEAEDLEDHAEAIAEATDAADDLGDIEEVVEKSIDEEGGLSPVAAEAISLAVASICKRVGMKQPRTLMGMYAAENYSSTSRRLANTKYALEGIKEFFVNLWIKIKEHVRSLWGRIVAFFKRYFTAMGRLKASVVSLKKKVIELPANPVKASLSAPSWLVEAFPGKSPVAFQAVNDVVSQHKLITQAPKEYLATLREVEAFLKTTNAGLDVEGLTKKIEKIVDSIEISSFAPLIGGVKLEAETPTEGEELWINLNETKPDKKAKEDEAVEFSVPTAANLKTLLGSVEELLKETEGLSKVVDEAKKIFKNTEGEVDRIIKDVTTLNDEEKTKLKKTLKIIGESNSFMGELVTKLAKYNMKCASVTAKTVEFSLKAFKKDKE